MNQKLVAAGMTPQQRADLEKEVAIGVANALKDIKLPTYYINGGASGSSASMLETLLGIKLMDPSNIVK